MASCSQVDGLLQAYIDEEMAASERLIFEEHLGGCASCRLALQEQRANAAYLFEIFKEKRLQEDMRARVLAHLPEMEAPHRSRRIWTHDRPQGMRRILNLMPMLVPALLLVIGIALFYFWPAESTGRPIGMVMQQAGIATQSNPAGSSQAKASVNNLVYPADSFATGPASTMMLSIAGPSAVKLAENSVLHVETDRRLRLDEGTAWFNVSKDSRLFRVITPAGEVNVFGTTFNVVASPTSTTVTVVDGMVQVENDRAFVSLRAGERAEVRSGEGQLQAERVDAKLVAAWSLGIQAAEGTNALFAQQIPQRPSQILRAEQLFVVLPDRDRVTDIHAVSMFWKPDPYSSGHCGYTVYVADEHMRSLLIKKIDASVFADKNKNFHQITLDEHEQISGLNVLHIKVVPDTANGRIETSFVKVEALGT